MTSDNAPILNKPREEITDGIKAPDQRQPATEIDLRRQLATATYALEHSEAALARMRARAETANARLERVQALTAEHPVTIDTALISEALDIPPAPAATQATEARKSRCDCPPTNAGLELCPACPGRIKEQHGA
ncbi:hypothetical protein [Streptomyces sp. NPDC001315]|uniref:hypothetical protein n=1 Tax=Streptomyces sp. NPDC001315 TaxID=3364562 RepID=UPI0036BB4249